MKSRRLSLACRIVQAQRIASEFEKKWELSKKLKGSALEAAIKTLKVELDTLTISTVKKHELKEDIGAVLKGVLEADRQQKAAQLKTSITKLTEMSETTTGPLLMATFENMDPSTLSGLMKHVKTKLTTKATLLVTLDQENKRVTHQCFVPKVSV